MNTASLVTWWATIYVAGDIAVVKHILRRECKTRGLCVTVDPTTFIYTGGEETGVAVGLVNYPRFPKSTPEMHDLAVELARILRDETYQDSVLVQTPYDTEWFSSRPLPTSTDKKEEDLDFPSIKVYRDPPVRDPFGRDEYVCGARKSCPIE